SRQGRSLNSRTSISVAFGSAVGALLLCLSLAHNALGQEKATPAESPSPRFEDISKSAGLTVSHIATQEQHYIVESMSGGVAMFDCDGDSKLDIAVVNGSTVERYRAGGDLLVTLYHQDSDLKFSNITQAAGLTRRGWGMGI